MAQTVDVAVIGGGIHGCSAALHLRQRGAMVALFEAGLCGAQASGVNFGGVRQHGRDAAEIPLAMRSRAIWGRIKEILGHDGEFVASGHLRVATSDAHLAELEAWSRLAREHGLLPELIGRNAVRDRYPWLAERALGASLLAEDGQANPRLVSPLFARAARRAGAAINENAKVTGVARDGAGFAIETWNGFTCRARILVNAAGAWGAEIASRLGEKFPLEARGPTMSVTEPLAPFIFPNLGVMDGIYLRQVARGNVVFGGGHSAPDLERRRVRPAPEHMARAGRIMLDTIPSLRGAAIIRSWSGIEGYTPDDKPVLGVSAAVPGLVHCFGFSGHGFQLGPGAGAVVAEQALDGKTPTDIGGLSPARFAATPRPSPPSASSG